MSPAAYKNSNRIMASIGIGLALSLLGDTNPYTVLPDPEIAAQAGLTLAMVGVILGMNRLIRLLTNGALAWWQDGCRCARGGGPQ